MSPISTPTLTTTTSSTNQLFDDVLQHIYSRRLLLHTHLKYQPPPAANLPATTSEPYGATDSTFDANVVMVLSVLLCALICSLGLNSIIKCALRCSTLVNSDNSSSSSSSTSSSARIANTGIKKKALKTFPTFNYNAGGGDGVNQPGLDSECVICLSEFTSGERVRVLPKCNHCFHVRCIDKWLTSNSSCPTCRHCLLQTCQKIVQANSPAAPSLPPPQTVAITIPPLEPEGIIANYRGPGLVTSIVSQS